MTADELFDRVVALCAWEESDKTDYKDRFIMILNIRLGECWKCNNAARKRKGMENLPSPQIVRYLTDKLEYEPEIITAILPIGVAGYLFVDDDETGITNVYREDYQRQLADGNCYAEFADAEMEW